MAGGPAVTRGDVRAGGGVLDAAVNAGSRIKNAGGYAAGSASAGISLVSGGATSAMSTLKDMLGDPAAPAAGSISLSAGASGRAEPVARSSDAARQMPGVTAAPVHSWTCQGRYSQKLP